MGRREQIKKVKESMNNGIRIRGDLIPTYKQLGISRDVWKRMNTFMRVDVLTDALGIDQFKAGEKNSRRSQEAVKKFLFSYCFSSGICECIVDWRFEGQDYELYVNGTFEFLREAAAKKGIMIPDSSHVEGLLEGFRKSVNLE